MSPGQTLELAQTLPQLLLLPVSTYTPPGPLSSEASAPLTGQSLPLIAAPHLYLAEPFSALEA